MSSLVNSVMAKLPASVADVLSDVRAQASALFANAPHSVMTFLRNTPTHVKSLVLLSRTHPDLATPLYLASLISIGSYIGVCLYQNFLDTACQQNLRKKYSATWALVTGASSGIGLAITEKLASQGINVVMVALDDDMLSKSYSNMCAKYPDVTFRRVGVNLGATDPKQYMDPIIASTKDVPVSLLFNNAGFITTGFFHKVSIQRNMANFNCNAGCVVPITHHFVEEMIAHRRRGLVSFTSSSAGFLPSPLSALYPSTKAFLTLFSSSIAAEIKSKGIDVVVVHPSPMATNFFKNSGGLKALEAFKPLAVGPEVIANVIFSSAGRFVVRDQGMVTYLLRILTKIFDPVVLTELICRTAHTTGDYKQFDS